MTDPVSPSTLLAVYSDRVRRSWRMLASYRQRSRRTSPRIGADRVAVVVLGGAVLIFVTALLFDARLFAALDHQPDASEAFFKWITQFGKFGWLLIPPGLLVIIVAMADWRQVGQRNAAAWAEIAAFASVIFMVVAVSGLLTDVLKPLVGRLRPPFVGDTVFEFAPLVFSGYANFSFPSGHATTMSAVAVVLAFGPTGWRTVGVVAALVVAWSRVMVGAHFPSDVVAGLFIGASVSYLIVRAMAYGGYGFRRDLDGRITWRFGVVNRLRRHRGWLSALLPALWIALRPAPASGIPT